MSQTSASSRECGTTVSPGRNDPLHRAFLRDVLVSEQSQPEGVQNVAKGQPTFDELVVALKSLDRPESSISKHLSTIIVTSALGLGAWMISSMSTVQTTLSSVRVTVDNSAKSLEDLRGEIRSVANQQSDMRAEQAELKQRVIILEKRVGT